MGSELVVRRVDGASTVVAAEGGDPLKLLLTVPRGPCAWVHATTYGGGLLAGDTVHLPVTVEDGARLFLATQASTKVYRSDDGRVSRQSFAVRVMGSGILVHLPDPLTPFAGSRFAQDTRIDLDPGSSLVWLDALTAGRSAREERWVPASFSTRLRLHVEGALLLHDALRLNPEHGIIERRMSGHETCATLVVGGPACLDMLGSITQAVSTMIGDPDVPTDGPGVLWAASPLQRAGTPWGTVVRVLASERSLLDAAIHRLIGGVVPLLGDDPWSRRA